MTHKERVLHAIKRQEVDRIPCTPFLNNQDWFQRLGKRWQFPFGPAQQERVAYCVEQYDLDVVVSVGWEGKFPDNDVSVKTALEGDVLHKWYMTPSGELHAAVRYDDSWVHGFDIPFATDYTIGRFITPWIETMNDVRCLEHIFKPPRTKEQLEKLRFSVGESLRLAKKYRLATMANIGTGLTGALQLFDAQPLCLKVMDEPEVVDAYLDLEHRCTVANYEIALDMEIDIIRRNGFYETTDYYAPEMIERFLKDRINEEVRIVHQAESVVAYTVLTGYTGMLDYLASLDIDCIATPDPFFRGENPEALVEKTGDTKSFWTGPSDTVHMPWDDQEAVRQAVRDTVSIFGKKGLILTPCSSAKAPFPWANVEAFIDEWKAIRDV